MTYGQNYFKKPLQSTTSMDVFRPWVDSLETELSRNSQGSPRISNEMSLPKCSSKNVSAKLLSTEMSLKNCHSRNVLLEMSLQSSCLVTYHCSPPLEAFIERQIEFAGNLPADLCQQSEFKMSKNWKTSSPLESVRLWADEPENFSSTFVLLIERFLIIKSIQVY